MLLTFKQDNSILSNFNINDYADIEGVCKYPIFISKDNTYGIYCFQDKNEQNFSVLSNTTTLIPGQSYFLHGKIVLNNKYNKLDFKLFDFIPYKPNTKMGIISFIETIPGLKSKSELIYQTFGLKTIDILLNNPEKLEEIKGIGKITVKKVQNNVTQFDTDYKTIIYLLNLGLTNNQVIKIIKELGKQAIFKINQNPYQLIEIKGFTYEFCDNIAKKLNFNGEGSFRINAAANYLLEQSSMEGNTFLPKNIFLKKIKKILQIKYSYLDLSENQTTINYFGNTYLFENNEILNFIKYKKDIVLKDFKDNEIIDVLNSNILIENGNVYLKELYLAENIFAEKILEIINNKKLIYDDNTINNVLDIICKQDNVLLEKEQRKAVIEACKYDSSILILSGSAGTGKTFITKMIVKTRRELKNLYNPKSTLKFLGVAPTGKASKVMDKNFAGLNISCKTIHLALEYKCSNFTRNINNKLDENYFIIDESSMLDISLAKAFILAVQSKSTIIFLGDTKQLPSIGPGNVLHDMIESQKIPLINLSVVKRQTALSGILKNAEHVINLEELEETKNTDDFYLFKETNNAEIQKKLIQSIKDLYNKGFYLEDIQVLIPQRTGEVGIYMINYILQQTLNPQNGLKIPKYKFEFNNQSYQLFISKNDKVMQTKNDYSKKMYINKNNQLIYHHNGITNGEIGIVEDIYFNNDGERVAKIKFENYYALYTDFSYLELAYAITIHKSQGSQWPAVLMIISNSHKYMLTNNLLYTAITRSVDFCGIIYNDDTLNYAIHRQKDIYRYTSLNEKLQKLM